MPALAECDDDEEEDEPLRVSVSGAINILYIVGIVTAVAFINESHIPAMGSEDAPLYIKFLREIVLVGIILLSLYTTKKRVRRENNFSWGPISEVAILFVGIFVTMTPALLYLNTHAESFGLSQQSDKHLLQTDHSAVFGMACILRHIIQCKNIRSGGIRRCI